MAMRKLAVFAGLPTAVLTQQGATKVVENGPSMGVQRCWLANGGACVTEPATVTLDANYRWVHTTANETQDCRKDGKFDSTVCTGVADCNTKCVIEGADQTAYRTWYGIHQLDGGVQLNWKTQYSENPRVYLRESDTQYKLFELKNREITFDVDTSKLGCGINGALYLVSMDGAGSGAGGPRYGTGYCDATCRKDVNWQFGGANFDGNTGSCCTEIDLWEANLHAKSYTGHTCTTNGAHSCTGAGCDTNCDKSGCDYNEHRLGAAYFYGDGGISLDANKPFSVVTQFLTDTGTDAGKLVSIKQFYIQDGKRIENPTAGVGGFLTDSYCNASHEAFTGNKSSDFLTMGGMEKLGEALEAGMVLVMSLWDDKETNMQWLDSDFPPGLDPHSKAGVRRGPCASTATKAELDAANEGAYVKFWNIRYGQITSTAYPYTAGTARLYSVGSVLESMASWQVAVACVASLTMLGGAVVALRRRQSSHEQLEEVPMLED